MSSRTHIGTEVSHDEQAAASAERAAEDRVELRPSVELEIQAKVDTNHPDGAGRGLTLEAEERLAARELEIGRTRRRFDRRADSDREARTRRVASEMSAEARTDVRGGAVRPETGVDPREELTREELGAVNRQAMRLAAVLDGRSRADIARVLAKRVRAGWALADAVLRLHEGAETAPGRITPIGRLADVRRPEVDIEGTVEVLWEPAHSSIAQVGLLADETGEVKFTSWVKSRQPVVKEGERVRLRGVARSWYQGRVSVALTANSRVVFPERGAWWER